MVFIVDMRTILGQYCNPRYASSNSPTKGIQPGRAICTRILNAAGYECAFLQPPSSLRCWRRVMPPAQGCRPVKMQASAWRSRRDGDRLALSGPSYATPPDNLPADCEDA